MRARPRVVGRDRLVRCGGRGDDLRADRHRTGALRTTDGAEPAGARCDTTTAVPASPPGRRETAAGGRAADADGYGRSARSDRCVETCVSGGGDGATGE